MFALILSISGLLFSAYFAWLIFTFGAASAFSDGRVARMLPHVKDAILLALIGALLLSISAFAPPPRDK
jgi:uncharacterized membrane protein SirB2